MTSIVVISDTLPAGPNDPGSPRLFSLMNEWSKKHQVYLISIGKQPKLSVELLNIIKDHINIAPIKNAPTLKQKLLHRITNSPFFLLKYLDPAYLNAVRSEIESVITKLKPDYIHVNQINNAQFISSNLKKDKIVLDVRDAMPLLYLREAKVEKSLLKKIDLCLESYANGHYLRSIKSSFNTLTVVARGDSEYLLNKWGITTKVIPNGVYVKNFSSSEKRFYQSKNIAIFTGVMDYSPNIDTAKLYATKIHPIVKERICDAEFYIVGANPTEEVKLLSSIEGVKVTGRVDDIRDFLKESKVFVSPMRSGAGIKNKILNAMAAEIPIVAFPLGIAGVNLTHNLNCLISEAEKDFAKQVISIMKYPEEYVKMVENAKNLALNEYSWDNSASQFLELLNTK